MPPSARSLSLAQPCWDALQPRKLVPCLAAPTLPHSSFQHRAQADGTLMSLLTSVLICLLCAGFFLVCGGYLLGVALHWRGCTALGFLYLLSWLKLLASLVK